MIESTVPLDRLTHRLSECPPDFLAEPRIGRRGSVHVDAVVNDLLVDMGGTPLDAMEVAAFATTDLNRRGELRLVLVAAWLLHDGAFRSPPGRHAPAARKWLRTGLGRLARVVAADLFVSDPDRREELARNCLQALGLHPDGETEAQAEDRRRTLDSVEYAELVAETRQQQERARQIRERMKRKEAEEAAAKASRE